MQMGQQQDDGDEARQGQQDDIAKDGIAAAPVDIVKLGHAAVSFCAPSSCREVISLTTPVASIW